MVEWWRIVIAIFCLFLSGLFSGLTLGLFALDLTDVKILLDSGSEKEIKWAKKIYPLRKQGNFLLCTLLIGNTSVNSALAILTADFFGGIPGFIASTLLILYIGEIIPQSICHKYGLIVGAYAAPLVYLFMVLTFPLSYPTSKVLDWVLGGEPPIRYDKKQLTSLVSLHGTSASAPLSRDETRILRGALELSQKTIEQVMTPLPQVFMLEVNDHLNFHNLMLVFQSGHSRVPVYEKSRRNIVGVLFTKDIILLDPDDNLLVSTVMVFFGRELSYVFNDTLLDKMLNEFKTGRGHLAIVQKVINTGTGDPYYETVGIITLEDVMEELIGDEIVDETDVYESNSATKKMARKRKIDEEVLLFFDSNSQAHTRLHDKEILAVSSYLSSHVEEFSTRKIPAAYLREMLKETPIVEYKDAPGKDENTEDGIKSHVDDEVINIEEGDRKNLDQTADKSAVIVYKRNIPAKEATLIITGRIQIEAGSDGFISEAGPWTLLGAKALVNDLYSPDFTARVIEYPVRMLKISRKIYKSVLSRVNGETAQNRDILVKAVLESEMTAAEMREINDFGMMTGRRTSLESLEENHDEADETNGAIP